jgi:DNA polymerase-3 subunit epsilon
VAWKTCLSSADDIIRSGVENLNLSRPLAFVDLETTGTSPAGDRIVEIAILKVHPDGREEFARRRVNPGVPIPAEATAVHGITDADVASEPAFASYARSLSRFLADCDIAGFGVARFDLPMLEAEFRRAGIEFSRKGRAVIDAMAIFHAKEPRNLEAAVQFYCGRPFPGGHSSEIDVRASYDVLCAQLARYDDLPRDVQALHDFCNPGSSDWIDPEGRIAWVDGTATIMFGKHKGRSLQDLRASEPDYLQWILSQDFSPEVRQIIGDALEGRFPTTAETDAE